MKKSSRILLVALMVIAVLTLVFVVYRYNHLPVYEGEIKLRNIQQETTVYFDEYSVPHIYANSQKDAMTALGYVHAQDRLWQMELLRRIAPGRLSEIFGTKALKNDKFFTGIGIEEASEKAIAKLDKNSPGYQLSMAYLDGINQFLDEGATPIEFQLIGVKKQKFTLKDVYNIFGYMSFSFAMAQKTDPLLTSIRDEFGIEYLNDFGIDGSLGTTQLKSYKSNEDYTAVSKSVAALLETSPIPPFIGSNSWVIAPQKTKNGKVIFANDPHIGFSQPGTWYEAHIVVPDYEMYGYYLAGTPFPLLGHNRNYAYGLTMFENDDIDFFKEDNNPADENQYKTPQGWSNYTTHQKTIKVKDSSDVVLQVKTSKHGPIMNDLLDGLLQNKPIAMSWIYTQQPLQILEAVYGLSHAASIADFHKNVGLIAAPGLNVMYGDAKGNVGWFASGKLYKKDKSVNTNFILEGSNGSDDKMEFLDFSKNPSAVNPPWNYVYSANNQPEAIDGYLYPGYYLPKDRATRIEGLLKKKNKWTKNDVSKMITDNTSATAISVVKDVLGNIDFNSLSDVEKQAFNLLQKWSGSNNRDDIAPTIFTKCSYLILKNAMQDELGTDRFNQFLGTHIMKQILPQLLSNKTSPWWDNRATKNQKETQRQIVSKSFKDAIAALKNQLGSDSASWQWKRVHTLEHQHPLGSVAILRPFFNVGPFDADGTNEVINNMIFTYDESGNYVVKAGPSTRRIIDFSDVENSWSILPTGQSGNPFSKHYDDQAAMYNAGRFRKMKLNTNEIVKSSTKLVFKPTANK